MAVSTWYHHQLAEIDGVATTSGYPLQFHVGAIYLGGSKTTYRRSLLTFDLAAVPSHTGRALSPGDTISAAQLDLEIAAVQGSAPFACSLRRIFQPDWLQDSTTWNNRATGKPWQAAGGDFQEVPPRVAFNSPTGLGAFAVTGLAALVRDALDQRLARLHLIINADNEAPGATQIFTGETGSGSGAHPLRPRLTVTYTSARPDIDRPDVATLDAGLPGPSPSARPASPAGTATPAQPERPARGSLATSPPRTDQQPKRSQLAQIGKLELT